MCPSERNKSEIKKENWLVSKMGEVEQEIFVNRCLWSTELEEIHNMHHISVDSTLYLMWKIEPLLKCGEKLC